MNQVNQFKQRMSFNGLMGLIFIFSVCTELAQASGHVLGLMDEPAAIPMAVAGVLLPSETGVLVNSESHFVLGWSWQVPITPSFRHRIIGGLNWVPGAKNHELGGRAGYRFGTHDIIAGLGIDFANSRTTWSPEVGIKFPHHGVDEQFNPSFHIIVRANLVPKLNQLQGTTVLFGWTFF
jgi:hypothetical protein